MTKKSIREVLLSVIDEMQPKLGRQDHGSLQSVPVLRRAIEILGVRRDFDSEQAVLTQYNELFRTGYLAWGLNFDNPSPPFFHVTSLGRRALAKYSRDPANPDGYFAHISSVSVLGDVATAYLREGVACYVSGSYRAAAVMVGCASERTVLELRDYLVSCLRSKGELVPKCLEDWKIKTVLTALDDVVKSKKKDMPNKLFESFESNWPALTGNIRLLRNDAGHPVSIEAVTEEAVHATLLMFPEIARLQTEMLGWMKKYYT